MVLIDVLCSLFSGQDLNMEDAYLQRLWPTASRSLRHRITRRQTSQGYTMWEGLGRKGMPKSGSCACMSWIESSIVSCYSLPLPAYIYICIFFIPGAIRSIKIMDSQDALARENLNSSLQIAGRYAVFQSSLTSWSASWHSESERERLRESCQLLCRNGGSPKGLCTAAAVKERSRVFSTIRHETIFPISILSVSHGFSQLWVPRLPPPLWAAH